MYGTSARFRTIFFLPWLTRLLTLSLSNSSPSPRVTLPFRSSTTTSPTARSSICMETLQIKSRCELNTRLRPHAMQHGPSARLAEAPMAQGDSPHVRRSSLQTIRRSARGHRCRDESEPAKRSSGPASPGELPGLKAFLTEHGAPLGRLERHRR